MQKRSAEKWAALIFRRDPWVYLDTTEGVDTGTAAKLFTMAGPVPVFAHLHDGIKKTARRGGWQQHSVIHPTNCDLLGKWEEKKEESLG